MTAPKWELVPAEPQQAGSDETWRDDPDECHHDWKRRGFNPNWGTIWECDKCGGVTP